MEVLIREKLKEIEQREDCRILLAVESGSRAWGFASPDSDYDVRFIYVRTKESYLRLDRVRDVIEVPINDELDINGWDVDKALKLLHKSNPTVFEWFSAPIIYQTSDFADRFKPIMRKTSLQKVDCGIICIWRRVTIVSSCVVIWLRRKSISMCFVLSWPAAGSWRREHHPRCCFPN